MAVRPSLMLPTLLLAGSSLAAHAQEADVTPPQADEHAGMDMPGMESTARATPESTVADEPGDAPPPPVPSDYPADRFFPPNRMAASRAAMVKEMTFNTFALQVDQLEFRTGKAGDGFGWEGQAWYGGDIDRIVLASEGEGTFGTRAERIELNAYWRHALDPWFNLQLGMRHDFRPDPRHTYALVGIEGMAPYWFALQGQLLVSNKGDVHARGKASYTQRITQSLVIEPDMEVDFALQDVPDRRRCGFRAARNGRAATLRTQPVARPLCRGKLGAQAGRDCPDRKGRRARCLWRFRDLRRAGHALIFAATRYFDG